MSGRQGVWALGLCVVLLALAGAGAAQPALRETALYTERVGAGGRQGEVLFVADDGTLSSVPVPAAFYPPGYPDTIGLRELVLSPDGTHLAGSFYSLSDSFALPVTIADLTLGACCVLVASPLAEVYAYDLAGFSPDGTQLAFSYTGAAPDGEFPYLGGMATAEISTGALTNLAAMNTAMAGREDEGLATWAYMGDWTEPGIQWHPNCYACEGVIEGEYSLWLPQKGSFLEDTGDFFSYRADTLDGTGETLVAAESLAYPVSPEPSGMFPYPNVIQYLPAGGPLDAATLAAAPVVFFDPAALDLGDGAHWAANGESFVVTPANATRWTLVNRAGATQAVPAPAGARFLAGTRDGWLSLIAGASNTDLVRTVATPAGAFGAVIDRTAGDIAFPPGYLVLRAPELGAGVTPVPPPMVPPPLAMPTLPPPVVATVPSVGMVQCPGFLPSRLVPGQLARVTPGDPNNLRALPDVSAPLVGRMPGGTEFMVLSGPICDAAGLAWWQVNYSGLIGWTVEGQGSDYWLEPMAAG